MSLESAPYYWLACDGCGASSTEDSEHTAWLDEDYTRMEATESDWTVTLALPGAGVVDLCWECKPCSGDDDEWTDERVGPDLEATP